MTPPRSHGDAADELWFRGHRASSPPSPPQTLGTWSCPRVLATGRRLWGQEELGPNSTDTLDVFLPPGERGCGLMLAGTWRGPVGTAYAVHTCEQECPGMANTRLKAASALVLHRKSMDKRCWLDENRVFPTAFKYRTVLLPTPKMEYTSGSPRNYSLNLCRMLCVWAWVLGLTRRALSVLDKRSTSEPCS